MRMIVEFLFHAYASSFTYKYVLKKTEHEKLLGESNPILDAERQLASWGFYVR